MKLYFTTYIDDAASIDDSFKVKWYGTQDEQKRDAKQLRVVGMRDINPDVANVPTAKAGLLAFLNEHGVQP